MGTVYARRKITAQDVPENQLANGGPRGGGGERRPRVDDRVDDGVFFCRGGGDESGSPDQYEIERVVRVFGGAFFF